MNKTLRKIQDPWDATKMDLRPYDYIIVNVSGGKDSQTILDVTVALATQQGVANRVIALHQELGPRGAWPGIMDLVQQQVAPYGVPLYVVTQIGTQVTGRSKTYKEGTPYGDWLDYAVDLGRWPTFNSRYCTGMWKTSPAWRWYKVLADHWRQYNPKGTCRILEVMGHRAEESPHRRDMPMLAYIEESRRKEEVYSWIPVKWWKLGDIWANIQRSGIPYHYCYDLGMQRCSCMFCVLARNSDLEISSRYNKEVFEEYLAAERSIGKAFKGENYWLANIQR